MKLYTIDTCLFKLDGGAMFGVVPKVMWNKLHPADENNLCTWAMRCLLIEDANKLILIDTGIGNKQDEKFMSHFHLHGSDTLLSSLQKHGFTPNDITDVLLTHLHFDHVGGAVKKVGETLELVFPNANYWSNEVHWKTATEPNAREKASFLSENILPVKESGQLKMIEHPYLLNKNDEGWEAFPPLHSFAVSFQKNIDIIYVEGHTESMMLPKINYNGTTILYMADLVPSVHHLPIPYVMAYDMNPKITLVEKQTILNEALKNNYVLFFEHDPIVECCTLQQTDKGIRVKETFALSELAG